MILVDTSVWIDFLRDSKRAAPLAELLIDNRVACHPWIIGELAMGSLQVDRSSFLADLSHLPSATRVGEDEVLEMVEARRLFGGGIGWVDAQLLASALVDGLTLWSFDRALVDVARRLDGVEIRR